jgi:hypothetical protein
VENFKVMLQKSPGEINKENFSGVFIREPGFKPSSCRILLENYSFRNVFPLRMSRWLNGRMKRNTYFNGVRVILETLN